jgi:hypothetical protein
MEIEQQLYCSVKLKPHYKDLLEICWLTAFTASLQQIYSILPPTDLSTTFYVSKCCRQIRCVASKSVRCGLERTNLQQVYIMLA